MTDLGSIVFLALNPYNGSAWGKMSDEAREPFRRAAERVLEARQPGNKVEVIYNEEAECWDLVLKDKDNQVIEVLGSDGGEPEDQLLVRDWDWVPTLIQRYLNEIANLRFRLEISQAREKNKCPFAAPEKKFDYDGRGWKPK